MSSSGTSRKYSQDTIRTRSVGKALLPGSRRQSLRNKAKKSSNNNSDLRSYKHSAKLTGLIELLHECEIIEDSIYNRCIINEESKKEESKISSSNNNNKK